MNLDFFTTRPGDKYLTSNRGLNVKVTYHASETDAFESFEYDFVKDVTGFDWLPHANDVFVAYIDNAVRKHVAEL